MGTVSVDNSGIQDRLDGIEKKVSDNSTVISQGFSGLHPFFSNLLQQLKIANLYSSLMSDKEIKNTEVKP